MNLYIDIQSVPAEHQRYDTAGDWYYEQSDPNHLSIVTTQHPDWRFSFLVALHELVEAALCKQAGITQAMVDEFDMTHEYLDDPGMSLDAPYHKQHLAAATVEYNIARELGVDVTKYNKWCFEGSSK